MVLLREFNAKSPSRPRKHSQIDAGYFVFDDGLGDKLLQIDTGGSNQRKHPGKQSQTIQRDRESAARPMEILRKEFNL